MEDDEDFMSCLSDFFASIPAEPENHSNNNFARESTKVLSASEDFKLDDNSLVTNFTRKEAEIYFSVLKPFRLEIFKRTVEFLESLNIRYFITYGTLLAVYRDGGVMMPYDHDTDLYIAESDFSKVVKNKHLLPLDYKMYTVSPITNFQWMKNGKDIQFDIENPQGMYKLIQIWDTKDYSENLKKCKTQYALENRHQSFHTGVFTDIFTFRENEKYIYRNIDGLGDAGRKSFLKDRIFPTKSCVFEGVACQAPNDPEYWLTKCYGYLGRDFYYDEATFMYKKIGT